MNGKLDIIIEQNEKIISILEAKRKNRSENMKRVNAMLPKEHYKNAGIKSGEARKVSA